MVGDVLKRSKTGALSLSLYMDYYVLRFSTALRTCTINFCKICHSGNLIHGGINEETPEVACDLVCNAAFDCRYHCVQLAKGERGRSDDHCRANRQSRGLLRNSQSFTGGSHQQSQTERSGRRHFQTALPLVGQQLLLLVRNLYQVVLLLSVRLYILRTSGLGLLRRVRPDHNLHICITKRR